MAMNASSYGALIYFVVVTMVTRSFLVIEVHGRVGWKSIPNFFVSPVATEVRFKALIWFVRVNLGHC